MARWHRVLPTTPHPATARVELRPDGVVVARVHPAVPQTVENARANLAEAVRVSTEVRRPILVDITGCEPLSPEVRREYTGELLIRSFTSIAMLVEATVFGRMIGNIYLQTAGLGLPARLFNREDQALAWLRQHL